MSGLRRLLGTFEVDASFQAPAPPETAARVVRDLRRTLGSFNASPPKLDLAEIRGELSRCRESSALPSRKVLRYGAWALLEKDGGANDPELLGWFIQMLRRHVRLRPWLELYVAYLAYGFGHPLADRLIPAAITDHLARAETPRAKHVLEQAGSWGTMEPEAPGQKFSARFHESGRSAADAWADAGCNELLQQGRFGSACIFATLVRLHGRLQDHPQQISVPELLRIEAIARDSPTGKLSNDPRVRKAMAEALLLPFVNQVPDGEQQQHIQTLLVREVGDPRIHPAAWKNIDQDAKNVLRQWLVQTTLEDFFVLLDLCSRQSADARRQWPYRRAFYESYLKAGYIEDSSIALRPQTRHVYRKALSELGANYGDLKGAQGHQAVLILKIGSYIVADWSYSGSVRIWSGGAPHAPNLHRRFYDAVSLRNAPAEDTFRHVSSENYLWQQRVMDAIRERTGIRMDIRELKRNYRQ